VGTRVNRSFADFISTTSSAQRLSDLANIYSQKGILSNTDSSLQATQLFYGLSANDQRSMFTDYQITQRARPSDLVIVVSHLYVTLADVDPNKDNTDLLKAMRDSLQKVTNDQNASSLQGEINFWLDGRAKARNEDYVNALSDYTNAINSNPSNQATLYERAKVFVGLEQYTDALKDLDSAVAAAKESEPKTSAIPTTASPLAAIATSNVEETQTRIPSSTLLPSTAVPSSVSGIPALTPILMLTPSSNFSSLNASGVGSYESNFTNLIDVVNAVQVLIQSTPELQAAALQNGCRVYVNLESYGLLRELTFVTTESATPQDTSVPTQSSLVLTDTSTEIIPSASSTQSLPIAAQAINSVDGATFIHVPAGNFTMGLTAEQTNLLRQLCSAQDCEELYQVSQPAHTVELTNGYWIDRTEVSNTQYAKCVDSGNCSPPRSNSSGTRSTYYGNPDFADYPVVWVDWDRANAYCHWAGGRLPTSAEWEKAASWDEANQEKYLYPWGNTFDGTLLNFCDKNCLSSQWADPNVDDGNTDTAPVESYNGGASPYGVLNMAGNVWEWVSDWFNVSYYKDNINWINPQGPTTGTVRVGRGGSFVIRSALTSVVIQDWEDPNNALPDYNYDGVGFRCVIPEQ
jgi:formylglycine-generating enzyme required for sulfatase activity